jgi:hypothetical protein
MPGMQPQLGDERAGTTCFEVDDEADHYLTEKRRLWSERRPSTAGVEPDTQAVLRWMRETLAVEHPALGERLAGTTTLDDAMLGIQEDLVVMRRPSGDDAAAATAVYLHVSFPTSWCPECSRGRTFMALHEPVPALHAFKDDNRRRLARGLFPPRRTTVRFVWSLTPDGRLDRRRCPTGVHPSVATRWEDASAAYFRVERQVVVPIHDTLSVFVIRVHRADVRRLTPEQRATLRRSVAGMDPALAEYKGLAADVGRILALLAG